MAVSFDAKKMHVFSIQYEACQIDDVTNLSTVPKPSIFFRIIFSNFDFLDQNETILSIF